MPPAASLLPDPVMSFHGPDRLVRILGAPVNRLCAIAEQQPGANLGA